MPSSSSLGGAWKEYLDAAAPSDDRVATYRRLFGEIEASLGPMPVQGIAGLAVVLSGRQASGAVPNVGAMIVLVVVIVATCALI